MAAAGLALLALAGCGSKFQLPTETPGGDVPPDSAFTYRGSVERLAGITDVMITKSSGTQTLVARGAARDARAPEECRSPATPALPAGTLELYSIFPPPGAPPLSVSFNGLWRPQLTAENGGLLFVFDAGDTCACVCHPDSLPQVVAYKIGNPAPQFSFFDSLWADVRGIAASGDRTVYLSGTFRVRELDEFGRFTRRFRDGIWRYQDQGGQVYARDTNWEVAEGTGVGFVTTPRGIAWGPSASPYLWVADAGKQAVQKLLIETDAESHGVYAFDGVSSGEAFTDIYDVDVDDENGIYAVDRGSARVLRFLDVGTSAEYLQLVNLGILTGEPLLVGPERSAVRDTIVYVADPPAQAARRYERESQ
jgi:hypothetical protein